jgi:hypothetical protein
MSTVADINATLRDAEREIMKARAALGDGGAGSPNIALNHLSASTLAVRRAMERIRAEIIDASKEPEPGTGLAADMRRRGYK